MSSASMQRVFPLSMYLAMVHPTSSIPRLWISSRPPFCITNAFQHGAGSMRRASTHRIPRLSHIHFRTCRRHWSRVMVCFHTSAALAHDSTLPLRELGPLIMVTPCSRKCGIISTRLASHNVVRGVLLTPPTQPTVRKLRELSSIMNARRRVFNERLN